MKYQYLADIGDSAAENVGRHAHGVLLLVLDSLTAGTINLKLKKKYCLTFVI